MAVFEEVSGQELWSTEVMRHCYALLVADGALVIAGYDYGKRKGVVTAYEIADGSRRFSAGLPGTATGMVARAGLAVVASQRRVHCYDLATGKLKWKGSTGGSTNYILAADDSRVVVYGHNYVRRGGGGGSRISCFDLESGKRLWQSRPVSVSVNRGRGQQISGNTAAILVTTYDVRKRKSSMVAYDGTSGKRLWSSALGQRSYLYDYVVGKDHLTALLRMLKGRGYVYERRTWETRSGNLAEKKAAAAGGLRLHEGAVLQLTGGAVECLATGSGGKSRKK
jgi:outer membrane protein assembly factor BamB